MDMVIMPADEVRKMMFEEANRAFKDSLPKITPVTEEDELLTRKETAQFYKVSEVTVWDWDKRGIINGRRIGNQVRYLKSELMAAARPKRGGKAE